MGVKGEGGGREGCGMREGGGVRGIRDGDGVDNTWR